MTRILALQHYGCETLGAIGDALNRSAIKVRYASLADSSAMPDLGEPDGLVVLGGPISANDTERHPALRTEMEIIGRALARDIPVLGICLGSQMLATVLSAKVRTAQTPEIGWLPIRLQPAARADRLFRDLPESFITCVWHGDIFDLPPGAVSLVRSEATSCQAYRYGSKVYGLLFHLEMRPEMVTACVRAFEPRLRRAGIRPEHCLAEAPGRLAAVAPIADKVFSRWAELVSGG